MDNNTPTINGNAELAKVSLVLTAIHNLQDVIVACYGEGEHYLTNFSDPKMSQLYYTVNEYACDLHDKRSEMESEDESE